MTATPEPDSKSETDNSLAQNNAMTPNNKSGELTVDPGSKPSQGSEPNQGGQVDTEDQYPHGLRLFLLGGASILGIFLISLDQVNTNSPSHLHSSPNTQRRPFLGPLYPRLRTISAALAMSLGTARATS